jgi:hypothetical protein
VGYNKNGSRRVRREGEKTKEFYLFEITSNN